MIIFDPYKEKKLSFTLTVEGIDPKLLEYTLRLSDSKVDYGFKVEHSKGKIIATIPPLNTVIKEDRINSLNKIKLEVNDKSSKYYLKPFEDTIKIKSEPKMTVEMTTVEETQTNFDIKINEIIEEPIKETPVKVKSKFSRILEDK